MSDRVTRSSARRVAHPPAASANSIPANPYIQPSLSSKKRKASARPDPTPINTPTEPTPRSSSRTSKRQKIADTPPQPSPTVPPPRARRRTGAVAESAMSNTGYTLRGLRHRLGLTGHRTSSKHTDESSKAPQITKTASKTPIKQKQEVAGYGQENSFEVSSANMF